VRHPLIEEGMPREGFSPAGGRSRGPTVGKTAILVGSKRLVGCGEFEEHQGASVHPHGSSMEDERWQGRL
jgi:hypothetical protein